MLISSNDSRLSDNPDPRISKNHADPSPVELSIDAAWSAVVAENSIDAFRVLICATPTLSFRPTMIQIRFLISMYTCETADAEFLRCVSLLLDEVFAIHLDLIDCFVDSGLIETVCSVFPSFCVSCVLSRCVSHSRRAHDHVLAHGIPARLPDAIIRATSQDVLPLLDFLAALRDCSPSGTTVDHPLCLLELIDRPDDSVSRVATRGLAVYLRGSRELCLIVTQRPEFIPVLARNFWREQSRVAWIEVFGAILAHPECLSREVTAKFVRVLECLLLVSRDACEVVAVLEAVGDGCRNGPAFVELCCREIVPRLFAMLGQELGFAITAAAFNCLCVLFAAADYQTQLEFQRAGLFEYLLALGDIMADEGPAMIAAVAAIRTGAKVTANTSWTEFWLAADTTEWLEHWKESRNLEVRELARELLDQAAKETDSDL
jgi:hypothetical protein